jgi:hypothetical protein
MFGNLSRTIVTVPKSFHLSAHITSSTLAENRYKEPKIYDTFSHLIKINSRPNNRYFRLSEHFKEHSPYTDLNFNNNKRYISPISKLSPFISLNHFLFGKNVDVNKKIRKSVSQAQLLSKTNSMNISKITNKENSKDNYNDTHSSQNINIMNNSIKDNTQYKQQIDFDEKNDLYKINEALPLEENTKDMNNLNEEELKTKNSDEEEKIRQENYIKKLKDNRPHNLEELKKYLEMKYTDETKKINFLPKITRRINSISQDDLFKQTLNYKLASLRLIKPQVKEGIFKRRKNLIMKRDYDLIKRIYNVRKSLPFYLRNIVSYEALEKQ